jgi:hypothetical protein
MEKTVIVSEIIEAVRRQTDDGIAFVKKVDGRWYHISESLSREKVGQLLRERLHCIYKSSTKAKRRRQREMNEPDSSRLLEAARSSPTIADSINHFSTNLAAALPSSSDSNFESALTAANVAILGELKMDQSWIKASSESRMSQTKTDMKTELAGATDDMNEDDLYDFIPKDFPLLDEEEQESFPPTHNLMY